MSDERLVFEELRAVLTKYNPRNIAVNLDTDIAFSSGMHAGEANKLHQELQQGEVDFSSRIVNVPELAVEFIGTMPSAQLAWYKKLQGTTWAMISEAFSEKIITPGTTTTEVHPTFITLLKTSQFDLGV